jgi:hypothetical protein
MKCPHCGHEKSRVLETRGDRRVRQCGECLKDFSTIETIAAFAGRHRGWICEEPQDTVIELQQKLRPSKFEKFHPAQIEDEFNGADAELAALLTEWWNEARWSKHKSKATWTRNAWLQNVTRVLAMNPLKAMALAKLGAEMGWQSLQEGYVNDVSPVPDGVLMPKDSAMQRAIETWNS